MTHNVTMKLFPLFYKGLQDHGWDVTKTQFGPDEWRINWELFEMHAKSF